MFLTLIALSSGLATVEPVEEITVTGARTPIAAEKLSSPVTIITAADIEKAQYSTVAEALKSVPSLSVAKTASVGGQIQIRVRGAEANQMLVILDGIELNDPAVGDEVQWEFISAHNIERIEVIRSPLSSVWGSDALAGVINIVTKSGATKYLNARAEYGSFNSSTYDASFGTGGDTWSLAGGVNYTKSNGVNVSRTGGEKDGARNLTLSLKGSAKVSDKTAVSASIRHYDARNEYDSTDWLTGLPADSDSVSETKKTALSAKVDHKVSDVWSITARGTLLDTDNGATTANKIGLYFDNQLKLADNQTLTLAVDHENTDFTQTGFASIYGDPNQEQTVKNTGFVADYIVSASDKLTLSAGLRHDLHSDFDDFTSWRVGASYQATETFRFFGNAARGQKAPTFIERFGYFPDQFIGNPNLTPEQSVSFEAGFDAKLTDQFNLSVTAYHTDLKDEIDGFVFDSSTFMFTAANKDGDSKRKGVEVVATYAPSDAVSAEISYSYLKATELDATGDEVKELRRPSHSASFALSWQMTDALNFSSLVSYTGKAKDLFFPPWPNPSERVTLDDYLLVRLTANYQVSDTVKLFGRIENALDENYEDVYGFNTPNRAAYAGIQVSF